MSKALPGEHLCEKHQGNHSHYAESNCAICKLTAERDALRRAMLDALSATNASVTPTCTTEFLCLGAGEIKLHIANLKARAEKAEHDLDLAAPF